MKPIRSLVARLAPLVVLTALFIAAPFHEAWAQSRTTTRYDAELRGTGWRVGD